MSIKFPQNFPSVREMKAILQKTIERSWKLVDLTVDDIDFWLENFDGSCLDINDERRLALWLLCNFTYFSVEDVNQLCKILYSRFLHEYIIDNNICISEVDESLKKTFFASAGKASESGGLLLYHFRQESELPLNRFFYPTVIDDKYFNSENSIVYVDDVTLTGNSFCRYYNNFVKSQSAKNIYYLTLIASKEAIKKISKEDKRIKIIYCMQMDDRNKCFSQSSLVFRNNGFDILLEPTRKVVEYYGNKIVDGETVKPLGYENGSYCFGFYYNTPNNVLPIFWSNKNWTPIFPRKEKLYGNIQSDITKRRFI